MLRSLCLLAVVSCATTPPPKIATPEDYQRTVGELIAQLIDIFKTDGINCSMLNGDLRGVKASAKLKAATDWASGHPDARGQAQAKVKERKADIDDAAQSAARECGDVVGPIMSQLAP
jgi:hypothetical protein